MNKTDTPADPEWSAAVAQASAWIALLHGPQRTPAAERGFQLWLQESVLHRQAFELATDTWNEHRALVQRSTRPRPPHPREERRKSVPRVRSVSAAVLSAVALVVILGLFAVALYHSRPKTITSGVAEQRVAYLEDGTRISLNVESELVVAYSKYIRLVVLKSGEAVFEVAKRPNRPFVVVVSGREVTALGTSFHVRVDRESMAVALIEGTVTVKPASYGLKRGSHPAVGPVQKLAPGERLTFTGNDRPPALDRPLLDGLTSWMHGKINMHDLPLAQAIAEMNRYSTVRLELKSVTPKAAAILVNGIFMTGDSLSFAYAVAAQHGWRVEEQSDRIVLIEAR